MSNSFKVKFGEKIKELRQKEKITQEELSFRSGVSRSHIGMIEKGLRDVSLNCIYKLSRALKVPIYEIFDFDNLEKYTDTNDLT